MHGASTVSGRTDAVQRSYDACGVPLQRYSVKYAYQNAKMEVRIICACRSETVTMVFAINGFLSSVVTQRQANACTAMTHPSFASHTVLFSTVQQGSAWDL